MERRGRAMNREMLQKLFSEDKEIFQGGMLFPAWICKAGDPRRDLLKVPSILHRSAGRFY